MSNSNKEQLISLYRDLIKCNKCSLCALNNNQKITIGVGETEAKIMIIGNSPNDIEANLLCKPFSGFSGKSLDKILNSAKIETGTVFKTYLFKCPTKVYKDITCYKEWLQQEINIIKPKSIILLGEQVVKTLLNINTKKINLTDYINKNYNNLFPSYDINYATRNQFNFNTTVGIFKNAKQYSSGI